MADSTQKAGTKVAPDVSYMAKGYSFVWKILLAVAVPCTIFALFGRWLDDRWQTSPWMTLLGFLLSLLLSFVYILASSKKFLKDSR